MEGEEKKTEATAATEQGDAATGQQGQAAKPKQNSRKRRNNKSAAERKAQKAKANAERAAAAARKAEQAANGEKAAPATEAKQDVAEKDVVAPEAEQKASEQTETTRSNSTHANTTDRAPLANNAEEAENKMEEKDEPEKDDTAQSKPSEPNKTEPAKKSGGKKTTTKKGVAQTDEPDTESEAEEKPAAADAQEAESVKNESAEDKTAEKTTEIENKTDEPDVEKVVEEKTADKDTDAENEADAEKNTEEKNPESETEEPVKTEDTEESAEDKSDEESEEDSDEKPIMAEDESELSEEERRHKAEITRTVQVSIEQILARSMAEDNDEKTQSAEETESDETDETSDEDVEENQTIAQRIGEAATDGLYSLFKWLLLVLAFAAVIAVLGVYWLYRGTTPDMVPQLTLSVDGQTVESAAYEWNVPVVGNLFKRTYAETLHTEPVKLAKDLENASPNFVLESGDEYDTALTVKNSAGEDVFSGTLTDFDKFSFTENDNYTALLVITSQEGIFTGDALVTGRQVYQFTFGVDIRPIVRVNTQSITQGGVVSVSVTNIPEGETPTLVSGLSNAGFVKATKGWIAYIPIPCEADTGKSYNIRVKTASYDQTVTLTVRPRTSAYKDYASEGALTGNYIGVDNTPDEVNQVLDICDPQVYWQASGFVQPFIHSITVSLPYGTTEYVGRTNAQRTSGGGSGRTSTCVVVSGHQGEVLISPADGRVVLAEDLGDIAGKTVVIEHGAGLKSIFYNLNKINVQEGDPVVQGQILGETNKVTVGEVRIGHVPVEPLSIWRGQCDAVKNF